MNYFLSLLLIVTVSNSCRNTTPHTITLEDPTTTSSSDKDWSPVVKSLLDNFKSTTSKQAVVIKLPKDTYHFYPDKAFEKELYISNHDQDNPKKVAFYLEDLHNVTIDGQGSQLLFHGRMIPFVLKNCSNIRLQNFSIDFELPQIRQLTIKQVDSLREYAIAELSPKDHYKVENNKLVFTGLGYTLTPYTSMVFNEDKRLAYRFSDVEFSSSSIAEQSPNHFKITDWSYLKNVSVGQRIALRTYHRPTPGIFIDYCQDTFLDNVTVHYAEGMGLIAQTSENITLNKFAVRLKEGSDRYFTTQADATHFSGCRGLIKSEYGFYEGMADDAINVHGTYLKIMERIDNQTVKAAYMHPQAWGFFWGESGDEVQFIRSKTMEYEHARNTIKSITPADSQTNHGAKEFIISFSTPLASHIGDDSHWGIENLSWTPEVIFNHNTIQNNRARGALFSTPKKVVCADNLFDHTHGTAILLCGDSNGWYETGACKEVLIKNNTFINALTSQYQFTNAIISIYPEIPDLENQEKYFHSGITIEDNTFHTFDKPILYAKSVSDLVFKNKFDKPLDSSDIYLKFSQKDAVSF